jgi:Putative Ig domain.
MTFTDKGNGTATLAGIPGAGTGGTYPLTLTAHNGVGSDATQTFTLTVNDAPAVTSAPSATFVIGSASNFTVTTTGFPVPSLVRGGVPLPSGVTFSDNGNGTGNLTGTPAAGTSGTYNLTFTAHNGVGSDAVQAFTLTVNAPPTPDFSLALSPTTQSVRGGRSVSYTVTVTSLNGFGGAVALSVSGLPSGSSGSFSPTSVTPTASSVLTISTAPTPRGTFTFTVKGTSGSLSRTMTGTLQVTKR